MLERCDDDVRIIADAMISKYHPDLAKADVQIAYLWALPKEDAETPALQLHGYPAGAIVEITNPKIRLAGGPDAIIRIDKGS